MEETTNVPSPNTTEDTTYNPGKQLTVGVAVTLILVSICFAGYYYFKGKSSGQAVNKTVLSASTSQITPIDNENPTPQQAASATNTVSPAANVSSAPVAQNTKACSKNGPAQKWEYLTPYVVKDGDTLQSIATAQLNNVNRVNEILQLNGQGPYVVGSTIYLPPSSITQSSGNIKEVNGMLVRKDSSYWQLSYSADPKGLGILIPSFWFDGVANAASFNTGDCIAVLFDDGNKVFSVANQ